MLSTFCVTYSQCMKAQRDAVNFLRHLQPVYEGPERGCQLSASHTASVWRPREAFNFLRHLQPVYEGPERLSTFCVTYSQCMKAQREDVNFLRHLQPVYEGRRGCQLPASPTASVWRPGEAVHDECWWMRMSVQICVVIKCIYSRCFFMESLW